EKIRTWVDELDRCQEAEYRGLPAVDDSELVEVALEGLTICELIRDEIPYYYVDPSFLETLPQPVKARVEDCILDWRGRRKIDGKRKVVDRQAMTFQPFGQLPPELPTMSAAIKAILERYSGRAVDPAGDIWRKLDAWHLQYNENFLGLPEKRGQTPRWRPGFDRLGWMAEGLALQQESYTALEGVHLSCGAAYLAIAKDEWDSMVAAYLDNRAGGPNETASPAAEGRNEKTS
ncbi:MAG: hypothetical protein ACK4UY_00705, partial [Dietzia sp.]